MTFELLFFEKGIIRCYYFVFSLINNRIFCVLRQMIIKYYAHLYNS